MSFAVAALYRFVDLPDAAALQAPVRALCEAHGVTGTLLLAHEGINGTVAAPPEALDAFLACLRDGPLFDGRLDGMELKLSSAREAPFGRLKVKLKREIVTLGDPAANPALATGVHVAPSDWNALIARDDVVVVDVRNAFEVAMGTFDRALDPETRRFSDFKAFAAERLAPHRDRTVALFCTGGIRCEKAGAHLVAQGFTDVRQLKSGILKYLEDVGPADSLWRGTCFVFDDRIALGQGLEERRPEEPAP